MIEQYEITLPLFNKGFHLITHFIEQNLSSLPVKGLVNVFIKHTSAGLSINENADPTVRYDMDKAMNKIVPENEPYYQHIFEGADDMPAHIKTVLTGASVTIPVTNGKLNLGTWQGIYLGEFRNRGGRRRLIITVYS